MSLRLIQLKDRLGAPRVAARDDAGCTRLIEGIASVYELASVALSGRLLAPIDHPDPAHPYLIRGSSRVRRAL
jgi:hypothetical protein